MQPADPQDVESAMESWNRGQRTCRARQRHSWNPFTVRVHAAFYDVVEQCGHCKNRRHRPLSADGFWLDKWKAERYSEGYLMPKGAGYITDEGRAALRLDDIMNRKQIIVPDDDEED